MGKLLLLAKLLIRKLKKVILDSLSKFLSFIFSDDYEKQGVGIYFMENGDRFEGFFDEDRQEGFGILFYKNAQKLINTKAPRVLDNL